MKEIGNGWELKRKQRNLAVEVVSQSEIQPSNTKSIVSSGMQIPGARRAKGLETGRWNTDE
jgi:hypothetical protein